MNRILSIAVLNLVLNSAATGDVLNVKTNSLVMITGEYVDLHLDIKALEDWTIGAWVRTSTYEPIWRTGIRLSYFEQGALQTGWQTGLNLGYVLSPPDDGFYDENFNEFCANDSALDACNSVDVNQGGLISLDHGYFWRRGRFNIHLAAGARLFANLDALSEQYFGGHVQFTIGWIR